MSLINNMLKDLQARDTEARYRPVITTAYSQQHAFFHRYKIHLIVLGFLMMLSVTFLLHPHRTNSKLKPMLMEPATKSKMAKAVENDWLKKATISTISLEERENVTEITLMLDHPTLYRLISNDSSNIFSLLLDNVELKSEFPPTRNFNTALQNINIHSKNGNLRFDFWLNPNTRIKYINLSEDNKNPELVIAIEHPLTNQSAEKNSEAKVASLIGTPSTPLVKTPAMQSLYLQQYQSALDLAGKGEYQSAINQLQKLMTATPSYQEARVSLAALLIDQGNNGKANKIIDAGLKLNPDSFPLLELKARILSGEGKVSMALTILQRTLPSLYENPDYHAMIAALYQKNNNDLLAVRLYKQLLTINPRNGSWWFGMAFSLDKLGQKNAAIDAYTKALTNGSLNNETMTYLQTRLQNLQEVINDSN